MPSPEVNTGCSFLFERETACSEHVLSMFSTFCVERCRKLLSCHVKENFAVLPAWFARLAKPNRLMRGVATSARSLKHSRHHSNRCAGARSWTMVYKAYGGTVISCLVHSEAALTGVCFTCHYSLFILMWEGKDLHVLSCSAFCQVPLCAIVWSVWSAWAIYGSVGIQLFS